MQNTVDYVIDFGLGGTLVLVGIVTNGMSARVFWHQGFNKYHVNVTLLALAFTDLTCLTCAAVHRLAYFLDEVLTARQATWWYEWVFMPFGLSQVAMARVTFCLTALLSLERWVSVCHPFLARRWLTKSKLTRATVSVAVVSIALNVPVVLAQTFINAYKSSHQKETGRNTSPLNLDTTSTPSPRDLANDSTFQTVAPTTPDINELNLTPDSDSSIHGSQAAVSSSSFSDDEDLSYNMIEMLAGSNPKITYTLICTLLVIPALCNQVVGFCTLAIIRRLRRASKTRLSLSELGQNQDNRGDLAWRISIREARLVKSTLTVMIIFIVCHTPTAVWAHILLVAGRHTLKKDLSKHLYFITAFMFFETLNSSVNFFVYITCFPGFKRTFNQLYPWCAFKEKQL